MRSGKNQHHHVVRLIILYTVISLFVSVHHRLTKSPSFFVFRQGFLRFWTSIHNGIAPSFRPSGSLAAPPRLPPFPWALCYPSPADGLPPLIRGPSREPAGHRRSTQQADRPAAAPAPSDTAGAAPWCQRGHGIPLPMRPPKPGPASCSLSRSFSPAELHGRFGSVRASRRKKMTVFTSCIRFVITLFFSVQVTLDSCRPDLRISIDVFHFSYLYVCN